jgi:AcrR family transcriptional regulator
VECRSCRRARPLVNVEPKQTKSFKRGRGRPKSFDRTAAIHQAMELFWDRGYEGTTFDDLIGAMKLSPSSFYHEFGSKERLYREAADYYLNRSTSYLRNFSSHRDTRAAFAALIEEAAAFFTNDASPDVHLTSCRVLLSLSGQHAADTRTRQRVFWRATSLTPLESPSRDDLANLFHFGFHRLAIAVAF